MLAGKKGGDGGSLGNVDTLIGKDTFVTGKIDAGGTIRIDGNFEGEINTSGDLVIGENGKVTGIIKAKHITVAGELHGNVEAQGKLELASTAKLIGDVKVAMFVVEEKAVFKGQCEMITVTETPYNRKGKNYSEKTEAES
ncbi:MAG: bactofilin family protein [Bacillota bacterium]